MTWMDPDGFPPIPPPEECRVTEPPLHDGPPDDGAPHPADTEPRARREKSRRERSDDKARPSWVRASKIRERKIEWLMRGRIPTGAVSLLEGIGGLGKSTVAADLAARITRGWPMPSEDDARSPRAVVWLASEDSTSAVVIPRLRVAGADLDLVHVRHDEADRWTTSSGADELEALIVEHGVAAVVIDALKDHTTGDDHGERDVRDALRPLREIAQRTGAAIIGVRHWTKSPREASARGAGSTAYRDVARSVLQIAQRPDGKGLAMAHDKSSYAAKSKTIAVTLDTVDGESIPRVRWGDELPFSADDLSNPDPGAQATKGELAEDALTALLAAEGPLLSVDAKRRVAESTGASERVVERARKTLGVLVERHGFGADTVVRWRLPDSPANRRDPRARGGGGTEETASNGASDDVFAVPPPSNRGGTAKTTLEHQFRPVIPVPPSPTRGAVDMQVDPAEEDA